MAEPSITLIIPSAAVGGLLTFAVQAALRWFNGKGDKPAGKPSPCEGCRFHADHETRIRARIIIKRWARPVRLGCG